MLSFPTNFEAEKNLKTGISPVWFLKCPFTSPGTRYISDRVFNIPGWDGSPTTKSWVKSWTPIDENIDSGIASPIVSDMSLELINDPDDANNIEAILESASNNIETTDCELYLWFLGLDATTDPPQIMWVGNMIDWRQINELIFSMELVDQSVKVNKYIGSKIDKTDYPSADPDDIGKIGNIGYGTVVKVPTLAILAGALDFLDGDITAAATTLDVGDASEFPSSGTVGIEEEEIDYSGKSSNQLTGLTRGVNSTTAAVHVDGMATWEVRSDFTYQAFDHPIKTFNKVWAVGSNVRLNITSIVTTYTGQSGDQHGTWPNKGMIVVPSKITKSQAVSLGVSDTIGITDGMTISDLLIILDPSHSHSVSGGGNASPSYASCLPTGSFSCIQMHDSNDSTWGWLNSGSPTITNNYTHGVPESGRRPTRISVTIKAEFWSGTPSASQLRVNGVYFGVGTEFPNPADSKTVWIPANAWGDVTSVLLTMNNSASWHIHEIIFNSFDWEFTGTSTSPAGVLRSGTVDRSGDITKSGTVTLSGVSVADIVVADSVLVDADCYQDDGSGTFTGTPNALIERADHVFKHFLYTYGAWPVANFETDAGSKFSSRSYNFAGVINEQKKFKEWLSILAFQCRCYFRFHAGKAKLIWRPSGIPASEKTITDLMIRMLPDATTSKEISRSPITDVINKVDLHYDREWMQSGDGAYKEISKDSDSASITKYGEKEIPELFFFDFVRTQAMADDVRDFYLEKYKDRWKISSQEVFLDNSELEFSDVVTFDGTTVYEILKSNIYPGSGRDKRNDRILLSAIERGTFFPSISYAPSPAISIAGIVNPTVLSGTQLTPAQSTAVAAKVDPSVVLGSLTIQPAQSVSVVSSVDPGVVVGVPEVTILDSWNGIPNFTEGSFAPSAGSDRLVVIAISYEDSSGARSITSCSLGDKNLTQIEMRSQGTTFRNGLYLGYLKESDIAARTGDAITFAWDTTPDAEIHVAWACYEGAHQTTPIPDTAWATVQNDNSLQVSSTLDANEGDIVFYGTTTGNGGSNHTPDSGYAEKIELDTSIFSKAIATKAITGSGTEQPTATWNSAHRIVIIGATIQAA
jgi:hypothetical protein